MASVARSTRCASPRLAYAELSLESGQPHDAKKHLSKALEALATSQMDGMRELARLLHDRALEATKREDDVILALESLIEDAARSPALRPALASIARR